MTEFFDVNGPRDDESPFDESDEGAIPGAGTDPAQDDDPAAPEPTES